MDYLDAVKSMTPDLVERLRTAVATGRWPDGRPLKQEQRENSLQAIIAWEQANLPEHQRTGYVKPKAEVLEERREKQVETTSGGPDGKRSSLRGDTVNDGEQDATSAEGIDPLRWVD
ncbi:MAG: DUF1315 family protein [Pseudomonadota bacterium]